MTASEERLAAAKRAYVNGTKEEFVRAWNSLTLPEVYQMRAFANDHEAGEGPELMMSDDKGASRARLHRAERLYADGTIEEYFAAYDALTIPEVLLLREFIRGYDAGERSKS